MQLLRKWNDWGWFNFKKIGMKKGVINDINGGYRAYFNDKNIKDFLFKDFVMAVNCLDAAYAFLKECKDRGLEASV